MRYAFLTPEFPTTIHGAGGLATYTRRMARLVAHGGHDVEVFVLNSTRDDVVEFEGYIVRHILHVQGHLLTLRNRVLHRLGLQATAAKQSLRDAAELIADAVEARHASSPFDVAHSPDYLGTGIALYPSPGRLHVVRCSAAMDLYMDCDGRTDPASAEHIAVEREAVARADIAIAPSALVADHYERILGRKVHVVRPPAYLENTPSQRPHWLPKRFLVHFAGFLSERKGTGLIAKALPLALAQEPGLIMIWVGKLASDSPLRIAPANLMILDRLGKPELYAVLKAATAAVLPSKVDNIPNTLVESLLLGTPVIVTKGASQDEMVEPGPGAMLIEYGNHLALADAMVAAWRDELGKATKPWLESTIGSSFMPDTALSVHLSHLRAAGVRC